MRPGSGLSRRDAPTHVQAFPNLLDDLGHERFEIGRRAARDDALIGHNRFIAPIAARIDYIGLDRLVIKRSNGGPSLLRPRSKAMAHDRSQPPPCPRRERPG